MTTSAARSFDRVIVIMFENEYRSYVQQNPYMRSLAARGIDMANYFGVMHPSNTNYIASIAGEICNVTEDPQFYSFMGGPPATPPSPLPQDTVVDRILGHGLDWKAYMESYKPVAFPPLSNPVMQPGTSTIDPVATVHQSIIDYPPYLNMHNPFVRFRSIMEREEQWKRIGTTYDFLRDCLGGTLPQYSWITPGIWSDGHWLWGTYDEPGERGPILVQQLAKWLESFFGVLNFPGPDSRIPRGTLVVVTFDESDYDQNYATLDNLESTYDGPDQIYTVLLGDMIEPGVEPEGYNHYSLLKTVEVNFGLESLGKNDRDANHFQFLWKRHFAWQAPAETPIAAATSLAAAALNDTLFVVHGQSDGTLWQSVFHEGTWSTAEQVPGVSGASTIALARCSDALVLVWQSASGLSAMTKGNGSWSTPVQLTAGSIGAIALTTFTDYGDGLEKLMLAYVTSGNTIQSQIYGGGSWSTPIAVGQQTDGDLVIATLGASLYLIHKVVGGNGMNVVSYNTADFNVVTGTTGNSSNTTRDVWAPSEYPVAHFGYGPSRSTPREAEPLLRPYEGTAPFVAATLDGVIHLAHRSSRSEQVVEETFSLSGTLTPLNPVDYNTGASGQSNGWGTLAEAGWSTQAAIANVCNSGGAMSMSGIGSQLILLFQERAGGAVRACVGAYVVRS